MKIVIISTIRNESDILETFVRYHLQFVDRMIIINHRSVDSSFSILESLKNEGLPLDLMEELSPDHQQGPLLTRIMKKAVSDYGADWVVPLDADEFIAAAGTGPVREIIEKLPQDRIVKFPWRTYVPLPSDDSREPDVLKRIQNCRRTENQDLRKIMIPRSMAMKNDVLIAAGNHGFVRQAFRKQKDFPYVHLDHIVFAHFPVRSAPQVITKAFVGWLACLAKPNKLPDEAFHLKLLYDRFKNGESLQPEELTSLALGYATGSGTKMPAHDDLIHLPLVPDAGHFALNYTDVSTVNPVSVLAQLAEEYAEALADAGRKTPNGKAANENPLVKMLHYYLQRK
jgi:hypothetical protein